MERLTYRLNDQRDNPTDSIILKPYLRYEDPETRKKILNRLAAYEDTGLEPEEIKDNMEMFRAYRHICAGHEPEHIRDLLLAEKDGIPKCGTKVFVLTTVGYWHKKYAKPEITECFVTTHRLAKNGETKFSVDGYLDSGSYYKAVFVKTSMGKTVFLTREEAEAALAQEGGTHEADSV